MAELFLLQILRNIWELHLAAMLNRICMYLQTPECSLKVKKKSFSEKSREIRFILWQTFLNMLVKYGIIAG